MRNFKNHSLLVFVLLFSSSMAQEILFVTPTQGLQGLNNISVTLVATGVNFFDAYATYDVYFDNENNSYLVAEDEFATSSNTLNFNLHISSDADVGYHDIFLEGYLNGSSDWNWDSDVLQNAFYVNENLAEITSITPNQFNAGNYYNVDIYGYQTIWDNSTVVSFPDSEIEVIYMNPISSTHIQANIYVSEFAYPGIYDVSAETNNMIESLEDAVTVTNSTMPLLLSANPSYSYQGENNFYIDVYSQGTSWTAYPPYSADFSGSGLNIDFFEVIDDTHLVLRMDVYSWASYGFRDLYVNSSWGNAFGEELFEIRPPEIISVTPSYGIMGEDVHVDIITGGINFYDGYSWLEEIYFGDENEGDEDIYADDWDICGTNCLSLDLHINEYDGATPGIKEFTVVIYSWQDGYTYLYGDFLVLGEDDIVGCMDGGETFIDTNSNGIWDEGESFTDTNSNGIYDVGACNFNPEALWDDFSCYYSFNDEGVYECDGSTCIEDWDNDFLCNEDDQHLSVEDVSVYFEDEFVEIPINLETYTEISAMQFDLHTSIDLNYDDIMLQSLNGLNLIANQYTDSSTQFTLYFDDGDYFFEGYDDLIATISYELPEELSIGSEIIVYINNLVAFDPWGDNVSLTSNSGSIIIVEYEEAYLGDVNFDGNIDIFDIVIMVNIILFGEATQEQLDVADINGDFNIDIFDIIELVNIILDS